MFRAKTEEEIKTHFMLGIPPPPPKLPLPDSVKKYGTTGQDADVN